MKINRTSLESVFQFGGEMFSESVFDAKSVELDIVRSDSRVLNSQTEFSTEDYSKLKESLLNATREKFEPHQDKKIGFLISGGVDSTLSLYLLKQVYPDAQVTTYHTDWKTPERSELPFAQIAAKFVGQPLKIIDTSSDAQIPFIDDALSKSLTISYSTIPVYMAFNEMVNDDIEIAVSALGLDELFAGYYIHKRYFEKGSFGFVPYSSRLLRGRYYRAAARRWGTTKTWLLSMIVNSPWSEFVLENDLDIKDCYDKHLAANNLWNSIHNYLFDAMICNFANMTSRAAWANGLDVIYPYIHNELIEFCLSQSPISRINKAPIRHMMRSELNFPEEIASRGEKWDKMGWGATPQPYFSNKSYMDAISTDPSLSKDWFTEESRALLLNINENPTTNGLNMALFMKTLELI
ncbi:MAG: asparagine synthase C-terminal domain-containing protein [Candidatus Thorarchaeota archaeon]